MILTLASKRNFTQTILEFLQNCPVLSDGSLKGTAAIGCRKISQNIEGSSSIVRECAYSGENVDGHKKTGNHGIKLFYYQCENENVRNQWAFSKNQFLTSRPELHATRSEPSFRHLPSSRSSLSTFFNRTNLTSTLKIPFCSREPYVKRWLFAFLQTFETMVREIKHFQIIREKILHRYQFTD